MLLSEIIKTVVTETGRPDQEALIATTCRTAILQLHARAKFKRDLVEEAVQVPTPANLIRQTLPPRFRSFADVAIVNKYGLPLFGPCAEMSPSTLVAEYGRVPTKPHYYVSGATYTVSSGALNIPVEFLYVNYYQSPVVNDLGSESWLTQLYPEAVINYAAFKIRAKNGDDKKAAMHQTLYLDALDTILSDQPIGD